MPSARNLEESGSSKIQQNQNQIQHKTQSERQTMMPTERNDAMLDGQDASVASNEEETGRRRRVSDVQGHQSATENDDSDGRLFPTDLPRPSRSAVAHSATGSADDDANGGSQSMENSPNYDDAHETPVADFSSNRTDAVDCIAVSIDSVTASTTPDRLRADNSIPKSTERAAAMLPLEQERITQNQETPPIDPQDTDDDVQRDAATERVACLVHVFFAFFAFLTGAVVLLCISIVSHYGIVVFLALSVFILLMGGVFYLLDGILKDDANWRPVRRRIHHWKAVAAKVVLDEVRHFQLDWNAHLLLTDGGVNMYEEQGNNDSIDEQPKKKARGKSVVFKVVKPFLRPFRGRRKRRKEKEAAAAARQQRGDSYIPPVV